MQAQLVLSRVLLVLEHLSLWPLVLSPVLSVVFPPHVLVLEFPRVEDAR